MDCLMDHIVLNIENDEEMIHFYTKVLLFTSERIEEYNDGKVPFPSVRMNVNTIIDLFPKKMWQHDTQIGKTNNNLNHFCISLKKQAWTELLKRLQENKIDIEEGPVLRWGSRGAGTSVYFRDPEENLIEARYYETKDDNEKCLLGS